MSIFTQRLTALRQMVGISTEDLARRIGIGKITLQNYETEYSTPDLKTLRTLADVFGVSVDYLVGRSDVFAAEPGKYREIQVAEKIGGPEAMIRMDDVIDTVYIPRTMTRDCLHFGLRISDDAMTKARIYPSDTVIVRSQTFAENGDLVVAVVGQEDAIVRRYYRKGNTVILQPETENVTYETITIQPDQTRFLILGKVVQVIISNL